MNYCILINFYIFFRNNIKNISSFLYFYKFIMLILEQLPMDLILPSYTVKVFVLHNDLFDYILYFLYVS